MLASTPSSPAHEGLTARTKLLLVASGILAILAIIVFFQNTEEVETRVLFFTLTMPRAVLLFLSFGIGFAVGGLFFGLRHRGWWRSPPPPPPTRA